MTPYADFLYFGILLIYILGPTLVVRAAFGFSTTWILIATLGMLVVQYFGPNGSIGDIRAIWIVLAYAIYEWLTAFWFLRIRAKRASRPVYYGALSLTLLPLVVSKFLPLLSPHTALGFLGISYVTFRALDVIFGIQDKIVVSLPPTQYFAFLLFFSTISSGPIDRFRRFSTDWKRPHARLEFLEDLDGAVHHIFTGFLYKYILAALIKRYWLDPAETGTDPLAVVSYMYAYTFYLFFDFAGYSLFAIGVSYALGIRTPENFKLPFLAPNIREFWNRWHISLSWWFRDHVYMRFLLAATKGKWFKSKYTASYLAFFLSFGLMGLWHGTETHYLLYGLYHATLLCGYDVFSRIRKNHKVWGDGIFWRVAAVLITFHAISFGFLLFSGHIGP
jgi:membrane protein involved in D-alanine export